MPRKIKAKPATVGVFTAVLIALISGICAIALLFRGQLVEAVCALLVGTQVLAAAGLWFAYRASTRVQRSTRIAKLHSAELKSLRGDIFAIQNEILSNSEREELWHDLTRKRIREKHNSLAMMLRKERDLHELTRKRLREKHNSLAMMLRKDRGLHELTRKRLREKHNAVYKLIGDRANKLETLQKQISVDLEHRKPAIENPTVGSTGDRTAMRNALFTVLERRGE